MLYLVPTPIGNLLDITYRAVETLKSVDLILCEDTRRSSILLQAHGITTHLKSFHKFSERQQEDQIISSLQGGKSIALISDAGTPGVADPGQRLVSRARLEGISVTSLPGASAPLVALSLSGFSMDQFQFVGFLPKKVSERKETLISMLFYPGVTIFFESPNRIQSTLKEIDALGPKHQLAIVREMTKVHEECSQGTAATLLGKEFRGEITVVLEGKQEANYSLSPKEHVEALQEEFGLSKQEAMKLVASLRGISKKTVYSCLISGDEL